MQPIFEQIRPNPGSSFYLGKFSDQEACQFPYWHLHPEYEIVYTTHGEGICHVGRYQSQFADGLLIMLGPNLPHAPFGPQLAPGAHSVVIQFQRDFMGEGWEQGAEWESVRMLLERSEQGIIFGQPVQATLGPAILALSEQAPLPRLLGLLKLLGQLAEAEEYQLLDAGEPGLLMSTSDYDRIHRVMSYIQRHYQDQVSLEHAAELVHLTVPAFCRFFKRVTRRTFTNYLHEYRIYHACQLLQTRQHSISEVAYRCGYQQPAYFNRQFKRIMGQTPSDYQQRFAQWVGGE